VQEALERALEQALAASGRERRHVFARLRPRPEGHIDLESSSPELLAEALPLLRERAGGDLRPVVLPAPPLRGQVAWTAASVAEVRREPRHESEQVSQALQGEPLLPLLHEDGWVLVRMPDGYVGWVRDWHLHLVPEAKAAAFASQCEARIDVPWGPILAEPRPDAVPTGETVLGTRVVVHARRQGWAEIELPSGRRGFLPEPSLRPGTAPWPADVPSLLATLRRFLGVPYLWGGRSPKGFDCSGLVQFAFGLHGLVLPRDSDEQAACGTPVATPAAGDLLFFGATKITHVAVALGPHGFLHARGEVRQNSLDPASPLHDAGLLALHRQTRRVRWPMHRPELG
jgi:hypothetical protein